MHDTPVSDSDVRHLAYLNDGNDLYDLGDASNTSDTSAIASSPNVPKTWQLSQHLPVLEARLEEQRTREVDTVALAGVLNEVRFHPLNSNKVAGTVPKNNTLVRGISDAQLRQWYAALGISDEQIKGMRKAALMAGLMIPTSGSVFSLISYMLIPFATQNVKNPWISAGVSLAVVAAQPFATSFMQSLVIGGIDYYRRRTNVDLKVDKTTINSSATQSEIKQNIEENAKRARDSEQKITELLDRYNLRNADGLVDADIDEINAKLSKEDLEELTENCRVHLDNVMTLCAHSGQMHALDGAHYRQFESSILQIIPRTVRAGSGALAPIAKMPGANAPHSVLDEIPHKFSPKSVTAMTVSIAVFSIVLQHVLAAKDELNGLTYEHKLNMLHADIFTTTGKNAAYLRGEIKPEDIDKDKCRDMVMLPEATMVLRVADQLDAELKKLKQEKEKLVKAKDANKGDGQATHDVEAAKISALETEIEAYEEDVKSLRKLTLPNSMSDRTKELLEDALNGSLSFAAREAWGKLTKPLEYVSQFIQRLGQTLTLLVLGSAGATAGGRLAIAARGGSSKVSLAEQFYISIAGMVVGFLAAITQASVTNIKNQRRDASADKPMSWLTQLGKGTLAPLFWMANELQSQWGRSAASDAFDDVTPFMQQARELNACLERLAELSDSPFAGIGSLDDIDAADAGSVFVPDR
ncbi:hypothetical protein BX592_120113 [Paraburkholderia rhizosphaerae]|uniref:Uncharacterized protein n=1 Tax=Paraburkholderia rhizosphaerae TaxID=480658 RepID=A0A4R8LKA2_9BURK|nr:hypothetical protein BX592_120113 [Paraburkholderia rhizosphaerae]